MKRILIVSSSDTFIERNSNLLRRSEFRILPAESPADALEILAGEGADLVIVDVHLHEMEGDRFCELVRSTTTPDKVRIILVCRDDPEEFARLSGCGADALIAKPVKPLQLVKTVGEFLTVHIVRSRRVSLRVKVVSKKDEVEFYCTSHNISVTGMLVETEYFLEVGSVIICSFAIPGSAQVACEGEVVRTARSLDGGYQYGIHFSCLGRNDRKEIDRYISSLVRGELPDSD